MDYFSMMNRLYAVFFVLFFLVLTNTAVADDQFGGIGVQVVPVSTGELSVLHVIAGSPADKGGLLPGDFIVAVGGLQMQGSDFELVTKKYLWGRVGTSVSLTWLRPGVVGTMQKDFVRVAIPKNLNVKQTPGVSISTPK